MVRRRSLIVLAAAMTLVAALGRGDGRDGCAAGDDDQRRLRDLLRELRTRRLCLRRNREGVLRAGRVRREGDVRDRIGRQHQARRGGAARLHARRHRRAHGDAGERGAPRAHCRRRPPEHDVRGLHARRRRTSRRQRASKAGRSPTLRRRPCAFCSRCTRRRPGSTRRRSRGAMRRLPRFPRFSPRSRSTGSVSSASELPLVAKAAGGRTVRSFKYSKVLPGLLGIGIVASDEKIRTSPGEVRAFTRALLRGLRYAIDNPGEAGYILKKHQPLADPIVAAQELRIMKFFVQNRLTRQQAERRWGTSTSRSSTRRRA